MGMIFLLLPAQGVFASFQVGQIPNYVNDNIANWLFQLLYGLFFGIFQLLAGSIFTTAV